MTFKKKRRGNALGRQAVLSLPPAQLGALAAALGDDLERVVLEWLAPASGFLVEVAGLNLCLNRPEKGTLAISSMVSHKAVLGSCHFDMPSSQALGPRAIPTKRTCLSKPIVIVCPTVTTITALRRMLLLAETAGMERKSAFGARLLLW